ncbi:MAG: TonB-dependent receptor family protein [Mediterranea sp.]|jgi:hypothetical protein|nr:TonB-dependent receptor family protein [Mediterranea sp.]
MKNFIALLLCVIISVVSNAQNISITGKVLDEKSDAVVAATISLLSKDSVLITGGITNSSGDFELKTLKKPAPCYLRITHAGFESSYHTVVTDKDTVVIARLNERSVLLGTVEIFAGKQTYEFQNDKLVVNINSLPNIQTHDLSRLLQLLPGVVNSGGSLTLNGKAAVVYLDGKKQAVNLLSLPVSIIEKVELIYSSGGVYDSSDEAIINIVRRKQKVDGYYLSLGGNTAAYDKFNLDGGGSATLMLKKKNVMLNSTLTYRNTYSFSHVSDTLRYRNNHVQYRDMDKEGRINLLMGLMNLDWDIKKGHNLNFMVNFYNDFSSKASKQQYILRPEDEQGKWDVKSKEKNDMWSGQVEYSSPDSLNGKLKMSYQIIWGGIREREHTVENDAEILYSDDDMSAHQHVAKFDYDHKFSPKLNLLFGAQGDWGRLTDDNVYTEPVISNRYPNSRFHGKEDIYAAYVRLNYSINRQWSANTSLRLEHTNYHYDLLTEDMSVTDSYTDLFPFFSIAYKSRSTDYQSSLSFGSSIQRPDYNYLLPAVRYTGRYSYTKGNQSLKPTMRNAFMFRNLFYQFINVFFTYEFGSDMRGFIAKNSAIDPLITEYEHNNIADFNRVYFGGSVNYKILGDLLSGQMGGSVQHLNYTHPKNGFEFSGGKNDYWRGVMYLTSNIQLTKTFGVNYLCHFYPGYDNLIYIMHSQWLMNTGIYYNSPKGNWSLSLDANDIFRPKKFREMYFDGNYSRQRNYGSSRYVQLSFLLKFRGGEKVEKKAKAMDMAPSRFSKRQ